MKEKKTNFDNLKNDLHLLLNKYNGITLNDMLEAVSSLKRENKEDQKANIEQKNETKPNQYCDMVFWQ